MLKNILIALGIAALTSSSAFAAAKAPKVTPATHKVAQVGEAKPDDGKAKKDKSDKKAKKEKKADEKAAEPAKK